MGDWPQERLSESERACAIHSEALWATARAIARAHPHIDAGDVYHALRGLELSATARLRQALSRGRLALTTAERTLFSRPGVVKVDPVTAEDSRMTSVHV